MGIIGPYELKDEKGRIFENIWQGSKIYKYIPPVFIPKSRYDKQIIWQHPGEAHIDVNNNVTKEYWGWREKLMNNSYPVRYPVGYNFRHNCVCAFTENDLATPLDYINARKQIYVPLYIELVKKEENFLQLKQRYEQGENLLIIEVDGPHQESLPYYQEMYGVDEKWIDNHTIEINQNNIDIMLNDSKHCFGHGYCVAMAILDMNVL